MMVHLNSIPPTSATIFRLDVYNILVVSAIHLLNGGWLALPADRIPLLELSGVVRIGPISRIISTSSSTFKNTLSGSLSAIY